MLKIKFHDIFYLSSLRRSVDDFWTSPPGGAGGRGVKNLGNGWSKSIVLENKVVINFDFRHGAKNQVTRATRSGVMAISEFSSEKAK